MSTLACRLLRMSRSRNAMTPGAKRHFAADASTAKPGFMGRVWGGTKCFLSARVVLPLPIALWAGSTTMQHYLGSDDNFFIAKFKTKKDPDDIAEFYQAEELLKIIAVISPAFSFFMNKTYPADPRPEGEELLSPDECIMGTKYLGMFASFEIIQEEDENEKVTKFMRHERFLDYVPFLKDWGYKVLLWDQTWTFGFNVLEDGTTEVYHRGEKFYGPWPVRLIVMVHQYYVAWACEKYMNGDAFGSEDYDAMEEELACLPLHVFKQFLARVRTSKAKKLEDLKNDPSADPEEIAQIQDKLKQIDSLADSGQSTISLAKRRNPSGAMAAGEGVKVVAQGKATQELLADVMVDSKTRQKDADMTAAVKEAAKNPDLEFKARPSPSVKKAKTRTAPSAPASVPASAPLPVPAPAAEAKKVSAE